MHLQRQQRRDERGERGEREHRRPPDGDRQRLSDRRRHRVHDQHARARKAERLIQPLARHDVGDQGPDRRHHERVGEPLQQPEAVEEGTEPTDAEEAGRGERHQRRPRRDRVATRKPVDDPARERGRDDRRNREHADREADLRGPRGELLRQELRQQVERREREPPDARRPEHAREVGREPPREPNRDRIARASSCDGIVVTARPAAPPAGSPRASRWYSRASLFSGCSRVHRRVVRQKRKTPPAWYGGRGCEACGGVYPTTTQVPLPTRVREANARLGGPAKISRRA